MRALTRPCPRRNASHDLARGERLCASREECICRVSFATCYDSAYKLTLCGLGEDVYRIALHAVLLVKAMSHLSSGERQRLCETIHDTILYTRRTWQATAGMPAIL